MIMKKYVDKNGKPIKVGDCLKDIDNFLWIVRQDEKGMFIECEDLLSRESIYPRARYCEVKNI